MRELTNDERVNRGRRYDWKFSFVELREQRSLLTFSLPFIVTFILIPSRKYREDTSAENRARISRNVTLDVMLAVWLNVICSLDECRMWARYVRTHIVMRISFTFSYVKRISRLGSRTGLELLVLFILW